MYLNSYFYIEINFNKINLNKYSKNWSTVSLAVLTKNPFEPVPSAHITSFNYLLKN